MIDNECVRFLQWALPQLQMRWPGFRRVRKQVCKRIDRRISALSLQSVDEYRDHLGTHDEEWSVLDEMCRVTISRFYRDKLVFSELEQRVLPRLVQQLQERGEKRLGVWSVGCASGEEPYTLSMLWSLCFRKRYPGFELRILATEIDPRLLQRAREACYEFGTVKNLPDNWRKRCFERQQEQYCLRPAYQQPVEFRRHDVRDGVPAGLFHLVLCRNLVFTYFEQSLQQEFLSDLQQSMIPGGILLLGVHESLPEQGHCFVPLSSRLGIYQNRYQSGEYELVWK